MHAASLSVAGLNHLGVAVADLAAARAFYEQTLGARFEDEEVVAEQGVRVAFLTVGTGPSAVRIELLEPLDADSPIAKFLAKRGPGLHHVAYTVDDVGEALAAAGRCGLSAIDARPRRGAHGAEIAFLYPKSTGGLLTELCRPAEAACPR